MFHYLNKQFTFIHKEECVECLVRDSFFFYTDKWDKKSIFLLFFFIIIIDVVFLYNSWSFLSFVRKTFFSYWHKSPHFFFTLFLYLLPTTLSFSFYPFFSYKKKNTKKNNLKDVLSTSKWWNRRKDDFDFLHLQLSWMSRKKISKISSLSTTLYRVG